MIKPNLKNRVKNLEVTCNVSDPSDCYLPRKKYPVIDPEHLNIVREARNRFFLDVDTPIPTYEFYREEITKVLQSLGYKMREEIMRSDYEMLFDLHDYFNNNNMDVLKKVFLR